MRGSQSIFRHREAQISRERLLFKVDAAGHIVGWSFEIFCMTFL